jgi:polyphosphate kinase
MFYNRDLSWLGFNYRVLMEARDKKVPLYERLKFMAIFSSNLDEFFRVRYPALLALSKVNKKTLKKDKGVLSQDLAEKAQEIISGQLDEFGKILIQEILPDLDSENVVFYYNKPLLPLHEAEVKELFLSKVLSFVQPVILNTDAKENFKPENSGLYLIATLQDEAKDSIHHVSVNIPAKKLKRFFELSPVDGKQYVVFIDDIVRYNIGLLFPGVKIRSVFSVKFNRNASLAPGDDFTGDLLEKMEKQISRRDSGNASRFLYEAGMPSNLQMYLATMFGVDVSDMYTGGRYHNLSDLMSFPNFDKSLLYPKEKPLLYPASAANGEIFETIGKKDILLHLPYHSYAPVLIFFNQAAIDPDVKEISITLYRVAAESHIVNALISAARNGKKVTAYIELKARFDEANNIKWSRVMKDAGVKLVYSSPSIKVHSKIGLIKRKSKDEWKNCAVLSTGNFNESTAGFYTDHVLFTCDKKVCKEMEELFGFLEQRLSIKSNQDLKFKELMVSQFNLLENLEKMVDEEIRKVKEGGAGLIRIKVNNLEEPKVLQLLKRASNAGVTVQMIVRSVCCLVPGLEKQTSNITIRRLVDKYLEHSRIFIFGNDDNAQAFMGSSDLMIRNIRRRIEVCIHLKDLDCKKQIIDYFNIQWNDDEKLVQLDSDMNQHRISGPGLHNAQKEIYSYIQNCNANVEA